MCLNHADNINQKVYWKCFKDVFKTFYGNVLKTFLKRFIEILLKHCLNVFKTFFGNIFKKFLKCLKKNMIVLTGVTSCNATAGIVTLQAVTLQLAS